MFNSKYYVYGRDEKVPAHLNFGKFILDRLKTKTDEIALENIDTKEKLSYKEFTLYAVNLSASLTKLGVGKGDTVGVGTEKRNEFVPTVLAVVFTGATYTPYDIKSGRITFKHKLNITQPKYFICSKNFWIQNKDTLQEFECIKLFLTMDDPFDDIPSTKDLVAQNVDVELFEPASVLGQTDVAFILYSSGTTGLSKGVQLTHLNCILNSLPDDFSDESFQTALIAGEWYHNYDTFITYKFLALGRKIVYAEDMDTKKSILRSIDQYKVNIIFALPSHVTYLSKEDKLDEYNLDALKIIYSRSSPLHKKTIEKVKQRFPNLKNVLQGYGMTEAGELTSESWGHKGPKPGSVGKPSPGIILKVSDLETRKTVGPNERGEICVKGPVLMKGYVGMDLSNYSDGGFLRTGDLGYYDEDGYFFIVGRIKEIIVYNGCNIQPLELETILQMHPGVKEAGVVGKPVPVFGEVPAAFIVRQPGSNVSEKEIIDYINIEASPNMRLRGGVKFIEEMPKNPRGKILKQQLKDMLKEM